jgi:uncharacterized protein
MRRAILPVMLALGALAPAHAQITMGAEAGGPVQMRALTYRDIPFRTVVRQQHDYSCGSAAVATLLTYHYGAPRTEAQVFQAMYAVGDKKRTEAQGFSLLEMKLYLDAQGYPSDGFRITYDRLAALNVPAIAMIDTGRYRHFVVVKGLAGDRILIGDPTLGLRTYSRAEFEKVWNGVAFLIREHRTEAAFNLRDEWRPYAPTPWSAAMAALRLEQGVDINPLYQIAPLVDLDAVLP